VRRDLGRRHPCIGLGSTRRHRTQRSAVGEGGLVNPRRRAWLASLLPGAAKAAAPPASPSPSATIQRGRRLEFPRDHGAHVEARTEWWYLTGWLGGAPGAQVGSAEPSPTHGFQITFFRSRVAQARADTRPGRFEPRHLLFAHAAVTDLAAGRHLHAQRVARWNGDPATGPDRAREDDADVRLARWSLARDAASAVAGSRWRAGVRAEGFAMQLSLQAPGAPLLQGDAGFSRKGPEERQASHYYSLPQLRVQAQLETGARRAALAGRAWLDHEWSDELLHPEAVGWDWIGMNLFDGRALTAFRLRRADGSVLWAGGSVQGTEASGSAGPGAALGSAASAVTRAFTPTEVDLRPGRRWRSPATHANYPVEWVVHTPAGRHAVRALLDAQELDSRASTGAIYWEGLAELLDEAGRRVGLGYLEMTGYSTPIRLG